MVVCNSSVLIALSAIGQLDVLQKRCEGTKLMIPKAVWREVVEEGKGEPGAQEVATADWIEVEEVRNRAVGEVLLAQLDHGEAEVIALAQEKGAALVLLDEKEARELAERLGLKVLGTVGLLIWAKQAGLIRSVHEQLDALQEKAGFRISPELYQRVLKEAGELNK
ncbi:DUF3368 domain-containing protein [Thermodesulforhabdus norvegica]|uniref:DUF3368 domain-containing protein n=1 Tax=Thermodesulforhabdus norvegica TaxID=39841 RepID=A0A1I4TUY4_9BACT|nr:DUF3368 domain-containing protein [Thermodesulforhabdus norvegica]SFM80395.1 hypothetical protein SAMN05660836_01533 [Thermodesulforhabdus norvegica]